MKINKTYTLRFVKLPPTTIVIGKPFDIIFSLTDDLGLELPGYPDIEVVFGIHGIDQNLDRYIVEDCASNASSCIVSSSRSLLHKRSLRVKGPAAARNPKIDHAYLVLKLAGQHDEHAMIQLDHQDSALMRFVKATSLLEIPDDEIVGLVVPTYAGPVSLTVAKNGDHAADRVSTTEVHLQGKKTLRIIERPLDKIIGDHLWHGSIILANAILQGAIPLQATSNIIELGAGCGLVSLAIEEVLGRSKKTLVVTDLSEVVESTLEATIAVNTSSTSNLRLEALEWDDAEGTKRLLNTISDREGVWLVAADILYNPSSHASLMATISSLCGAFKNQVVTIAYRPRTLGDDDFFDLAKARGFPFQLLLHLADVQIWQYSNA